MEDRDRIEQLVKMGKLSEHEARKLIAAIDYLEFISKATAGGPSVRRPSRAELLRAEFLSGRIDERQYLAQLKLQAVFAGLFFAVLMLPTYAGILTALGEPLTGERLLLLSAGWSAGGLFFGLATYLFVMRPAALKLTRLRGYMKGEWEPVPTSTAGQCPLCGSRDVIKRDWTNVLLLLWVVNPLVAFNELVLGQRVPNVTEQCRGCGTAFVSCGTCNSSVDMMFWSGAKAFGNWTGLRCPKCNDRIPCPRNGLAWILLLPFWPLRKLFP